MSEETDKESQTENATEKKLSDSMERGDVPMSREVALVASLACILISMIFLLRSGAQHLVGALILFLDDSGGLRLERSDDVMALMRVALSEMFSFLTPTIALLIVGGIVASMAQHAPRFVLERIQPDLGRISPMKGLSRIFGPRGLTEFLKSVAKLVAVGAIAVVVMNSERISLINMMFVDVG